MNPKLKCNYNPFGNYSTTTVRLEERHKQNKRQKDQRGTQKEEEARKAITTTSAAFSRGGFRGKKLMMLEKM